MDRVIVIAAGMGSRLEHHTDERPKCMVRVGGKSILDHQLDALRANGVDDIHIVRGYLSDRLVVPGATYYENAAFRSNNILHSLFFAREAIDGPLLTTYSDIVYTSGVVERLLDSPHDISLVVDREWAKAYEGRDDHPPEQAELVEMDGERVTRVGKVVGPGDAVGEFIGLAKYSAAGARALREAFDEVRQRLDDDDPFQNAALFRKAYLTDLFQEMIDDGVELGVTFIDGEWREIDTVQDLERVNEEWG